MGKSIEVAVAGCVDSWLYFFESACDEPSNHSFRKDINRLICGCKSN